MRWCTRALALFVSMVLVLLAVTPASAGKWDPYEGNRARDLRWLGAVYTSNGDVQVTISYWRALDPSTLPAYWYTGIHYGAMYGVIKVTKRDRFRLVGWGEPGSNCCSRFVVHQQSPRVLRFTVPPWYVAEQQSIRARTTKDVIWLKHPKGDLAV